MSPEQIVAWLWVLLAVILGCLELATGTLMLLLFAVAASLAAVVGFAGGSIAAQSVIFLLGTIGAVALAPVLVKRVNRLSRGSEKFGIDALIDRIGVVTRAIDPIQGTGQVTVDGQIWRATASGAVAEGEPVRIAEICGTRLLVYPVPTAEGEVRERLTDTAATPLSVDEQ